MATIKTLRMLDNDIIYPFEWIEDKDALKQRIINRLKSFIGEWYLNASEGIDWLSLLGKNFDEKNVQQVLKKELLKDELVTNVNEITVKYISTTKASAENRLTNRTLLINVSLGTTFGTITFEESL